MGLLEKISQAGVVGCGGAGFPTAVKLAGSFKHLIVNGAECEPLLRTDRYLMINRAAELVSAITAIKNELALEKCTIALKEEYTQEISSLTDAVKAANADIEIRPLPAFYPLGDEQVLIYEVTGEVVPPASLPSSVGVVIDNIGTINAIYDALHGQPLIRKFLTVTGEVNAPMVISAPVGTPLTECIEAAGGTKTENFCLVLGGPMMGRVITKTQAEGETVTKTTSGIIVVKNDSAIARRSEVSIEHMIKRAGSACIQCSRCTDLCPRHQLGHPLAPHKIMRKMATLPDKEVLLSDKTIRTALLCSECGVCEVFACPMGIQPRRINSELKKMLGSTGIRWNQDDSVLAPVSRFRECRQVPTKKIASRAGVLKYFDRDISSNCVLNPEIVRIPVKMHIGAPCTPVVRVGDRIEQGQLIAKCPDGSLGADIHGSISGIVSEVGDRIVIQKG